MRGLGVTVLVLAVACLWSPRTDARSYSSYWKSPRRTDYVLDHKFYNYLERVTRAPFTELRKAQLILTSYREANKYSANGDANDAARIFFSLKPRSITFSTVRNGRCGFGGCRTRRYRRRNRYRTSRSYYRTNGYKRRYRRSRRKFTYRAKKYGKKIVRKLLRGSAKRKSKGKSSVKESKSKRPSYRKSAKGKKWRGSGKGKSQRGSKRMRGRKGSKGKVWRSNGYKRVWGRWGSRRGSRRGSYVRRYRPRRRGSLTARGRVGIYDVVLMTSPSKAQIVFIPRRSVYSYNRELRIKRTFTFKTNTFWQRILYRF